MHKKTFLLLILLVIACSNNSLIGQTPTPSPIPTEPENEEILRIDSGLIQTSVTVLDKNGKFITGLSKDDFEVHVDKKDVIVRYFDAVSKFRGGFDPQTKNSEKTENRSETYPEFGKNILFYVDDHHLSQEGAKRVNDIISKFIRNEMNPSDSVAIVSPTNRIGFLQQFSNDRQMLLTALGKLKGVSGKSSLMGAESPPMTPYEAMLVERNDREVIDNFYDVEKKLYLIADTREQYAMRLKVRARAILAQERIYSGSSLKNLAASLKYAQRISGRKVIVYLSEGFLVDQRNTNNQEYLRAVTDMALRSNSVIYSFDVKGLDSGLLESTTSSLSPNALGFRVQAGERTSLLNGLNDMADSTGGKLFTNSNDIGQQVNQALDEASGYYVLAWDLNDEQADRGFRNINVSVRNRPNLVVRFQSGYLAEEKAKTPETPAGKSISAENNTLEKSLYSPISNSSFPIYMVPDYAQTPDGAVVNVGVQIPYQAVPASGGSSEKTSFRIKAEVFSDEGKKIAEYEQTFAANHENNKLNDQDSPAYIYNIALKPEPGFYQIRVAVQNAKSGRIGNISKWVEVPDLKSGAPALSSLIVNNVLSDGKTRRNADGSYNKKGDLRYLLYIYQSPNRKSPLLADSLSVNEKIYFQNKLIFDQNSVPQPDQTGNFFYGGDILLSSLSSGRYEMEITVTDKKSKKSSTRWAIFRVN